MNSTVRKAKVVNVYEAGISTDGFGTVDGNPDREVIAIEGINCSNDEFIEWFLETPGGADFCSDGENLIDIGGSSLDLSVSSVICASYTEWFAKWLDGIYGWARFQVGEDVINSCVVLGIQDQYSKLILNSYPNFINRRNDFEPLVRAYNHAITPRI